MNRPAPLDADVAAALRAVSERRLSEAEFSAALAVPVTPEERAEVLSLVTWFCRRYPTPADRLAYVRRAYRRWSTRPASSGRGGRPAAVDE